MKQHISSMVERVLVITSSASKLNESCQTVIENARLTQSKTTILQRMRKQIPMLDTLFKKFLPNENFDEQQAAVSFQRSASSIDLSSVLDQPNQKVTHLKQFYVNYTPIIEEKQEIRRIIDSIKDANRNSPTVFTKDVFAAYQKRGGERTYEELEGKLEGDMIFLIKRENESKQRMLSKYRS